MHLRHVAERLRYLASSVDPKELDGELHALARECEAASREPPKPGMVAAARDMYAALEEIVQVMNERGQTTDRVKCIATGALALADSPQHS